MKTYVKTSGPLMDIIRISLGVKKRINVARYVTISIRVKVLTLQRVRNSRGKIVSLGPFWETASL